MSKEFTYSMPQSFLVDKSVPIRWRVWAIINGFFIAGKEFWASNEWIAEQLNCHKDSVSQGVKELEDLGMMHSKRTRRSRVIYPGTGEIGANAYLRSAATPISDRPERLSISDSISGKDTGELASEIRVVEVSSFEGEEKAARKPAKYPNFKEVSSWFPKDLVEPSWKLNTTLLKHSELLHKRGETAVRGIIKFCRQNEGDAFFPVWQDPTSLERNWSKIIKFADRNGI